MKDLRQKLTSRKFLAAVAGVVTGLAMVFGLDASIINTVAGAVTAVASVVSYIVTEGRIDAAGVQAAAQAVEAVKEVLEE